MNIFEAAFTSRLVNRGSLIDSFAFVSVFSIKCSRSLLAIIGKHDRLVSQWRIQDFPNGGTNPQSGAPTYCLAKFFPRTAWKWKKLHPEGRAYLVPPFDPQVLANNLCCTKPCWGVNEKIALWIVIFANDWTAESALISCNSKLFLKVRNREVRCKMITTSKQLHPSWYVSASLCHVHQGTYGMAIVFHFTLSSRNGYFHSQGRWAYICAETHNVQSWCSDVSV